MAGANAPYYTNNKVDDVDFIEAADLEALESGFADVDTDKADKAVPVAANDLAALAADGNLADSGKTAPTGDIVGTTDTQTLTNKTLTAPAVNSGVLDSPNITTTWSISGAAVTVSAAQINVLASVTASAAELNILDGVTATAAEINVLDGVVGVTAAEISYLASVTSDIQTQLDAKAEDSGNATLTGVETLTNKTVEALILNAGYSEEVFALSGTTSVSLDPANGTIQTQTLTDDTSYADNLAAGESIVLMVDDGAAHEITWPTISWVGTTQPTLEISGENVFVLWKVGSTLYGLFVGAA